MALEGIRVVDVTQGAAGPMAGRHLADWGADVIHIEHPIRGDWTRGEVTSRQTMVDWAHLSNVDYVWEDCNRNKKSVTIDLAQERGRGILYRLVEKADVFMTNLRPRELQKFGLEYDTLSRLNPRLIFASLTGYGRKGPDKDQPAYDTTGFWSRSGILHLMAAGGTPPNITAQFGDNIGALTFACGMILALLARERTGIGQEIDVSLFNSGIYAISYEIAGALVTGKDGKRPRRENFRNPLLVPYLTKDGRWLYLCVLTPEPYWSRFCEAIERKDLEHDPRFDSLSNIEQNHRALFEILEKEVFPTKTLAEWRTRLTEWEVPFAPIQTLQELIADPQARANDFFITVDHPTYGAIEEVASPIKLSKTPATIRMPGPKFSQHTEEVLLELGYTWEDIEQFKDQGVIA
jgi:crotonobetainyl-CoA:carnitine CoA-transferase CaiB-like acyl-CoA transferase